MYLRIYTLRCLCVRGQHAHQDVHSQRHKYIHSYTLLKLLKLSGWARTGMWSHAGVQRDTNTKVLHIHLIELAVYFPLTAKRHGHYRQLSHILRDKSFCFTHQNTCWSCERERQLEKELSFVSWSIDLPKSLFGAIELQIIFFIILIHKPQAKFPSLFGFYSWEWNCPCIKLSQARFWRFFLSLPGTDMISTTTAPEHFRIFVPETSLWGREVLLFPFLHGELRHWGAENHKGHP